MLGLIGIIYIASVMAVLGVEVNVVLARRLWPRALLTPFTDSVDLTEADRRAYAMYAQMQRHKGFETVERALRRPRRRHPRDRARARRPVLGDHDVAAAPRCPRPPPPVSL